jgi:hypothetical protein
LADEAERVVAHRPRVRIDRRYVDVVLPTRKVLDQVGAAAYHTVGKEVEIKPVGPAPPRQKIVPCAPGQDVAPGIPVQNVIAVTTPQKIGATPAADRIIAGPAIQRVRPRIPDQRVVKLRTLKVFDSREEIALCIGTGA